MVVAFYFRLHLAYFPRPVVAIFARPEQGQRRTGSFSTGIGPQAKHEYKNNHGFGDLSQQSEGRNHFPYRP